MHGTQRWQVDNLTKCDKVKMYEKVTRLISMFYTYIKMGDRDGI